MIFLAAMVILPFVLHADPSASMFRSKDQARRYECESTTAEQGDTLRPGQVVTSPPRGDYVERDAVICVERLMRPGLRAPRDEAILSSLDGITSELASNAVGRRSDLADRTWLVESYYPSATVSAKLSFATRSALMAQGLAVSERAPTLNAADVEVLTHLDPMQAYPAACQRYSENKSLDERHALLAIVSLDNRETILHAGTCVDGQWSWVQ